MIAVGPGFPCCDSNKVWNMTEIKCARWFTKQLMERLHLRGWNGSSWCPRTVLAAEMQTLAGAESLKRCFLHFHQAWRVVWDKTLPDIHSSCVVPKKKSVLESDVGGPKFEYPSFSAHYHHCAFWGQSFVTLGSQEKKNMELVSLVHPNLVTTSEARSGKICMWRDGHWQMRFVNVALNSNQVSL